MREILPGNFEMETLTKDLPWVLFSVRLSFLGELVRVGLLPLVQGDLDAPPRPDDI